MRAITLQLTTRSDHEIEMPTSGQIEISEAMLQKVQTLAALCRQHDLYALQFFDFSAEWDWDDETEMDLFWVTPDSIRFSACPKHLDLAFETDDILIRDIEKAFQAAA